MVNVHTLTRSLQYKLASSFVRYRGRGVSTVNGPAYAAVASITVLSMVLVEVVAIAKKLAASCSVATTAVGPATSGSAVEWTPGLILFLIGAVALLSIPIIVVSVYSDRWARRRRVRLRRQFQGFVVEVAGVGICLMAPLIFLITALLGDPCDPTVPDLSVWLAVLFVGGFALWWIGQVRAHDTGWTGFAYILIFDAAFVYVFAGVVFSGHVSGTAQVFLVAFLVHGFCAGIALYWSYSVASQTCSTAVDRAKAGEAGRSLAALWVLLFVAVIASWVIPQSDGSQPQQATRDILDALGTPIIAALSLGALLVTMGSGYTKYAEGRDGSQNGPRRRSPDRQDWRVAATAARMVAATGPLDLTSICNGVRRVCPRSTKETEIRRGLESSRLLSELKGRWELHGPNGALAWPTDRRLLEKSAATGRSSHTTKEMVDLLCQAGYKGLRMRDYLLHVHPLIMPVRKIRTFRLARRWVVIRGDLKID